MSSASVRAAFPLHIPTLQRGDASETNEGMTLREYFAAHAPMDVPEWFVHVEPPRNYPADVSLDEISKDVADVHRKLAQDWRWDPCYDLENEAPELKWYADKVRAHRAGLAQWKDDNLRVRYFQWRWAYADGMLAAGEAS